MSSIKSGGRFGSTQSTVLTLKALTRYAEIYQGIKGKGQFKLMIDGKLIHTIAFDEMAEFNQKLDFTKPLNNHF